MIGIAKREADRPERGAECRGVDRLADVAPAPVAPASRSEPIEHCVALSVVIPAHDEEAAIAELLREIAAALDGLVDYEIVVVDDWSTDQTPVRLAEARRDFPQLRALRHDRCYGQSAALATGIRAARGVWIATLDADGQNDPADIARIWQIRDRAGLIVGHRVKREDSWLKRLSSRIANNVRRWMLHDDTPDTGCGLKLFRRDAFLSLPTFDHFHRFLPALFIRQGHSVLSTPVNHRPRRGGRSHYGIGNRMWVGIVDLLGVMWLSRRSVAPRRVDELS